MSAVADSIHAMFPYIEYEEIVELLKETHDEGQVIDILLGRVPKKDGVKQKAKQENRTFVKRENRNNQKPIQQRSRIMPLPKVEINPAAATKTPWGSVDLSITLPPIKIEKEPVKEEKPQQKVEQKPAPQPEVKPQQKVEQKPAPQPEVKPQQKVEQKPAPQPEVKPQQKVEQKPAPQPEVKPQQKVEQKPAPQPEVKPQQKAEQKPAPQPNTDFVSVIKPTETTMNAPAKPVLRFPVSIRDTRVNLKLFGSFYRNDTKSIPTEEPAKPKDLPTVYPQQKKEEVVAPPKEQAQPQKVPDHTHRPQFYPSNLENPVRNEKRSMPPGFQSTK